MLDHADDVQLVRVYKTEATGPGPATQLWVVALPRDQAEGAVQKLLPDGLRAELAAERLPAMTIDRLGLRPGEVREMKSA